MFNITDIKEQREIYVGFLRSVVDDNKTTIIEADLAGSIGTNKIKEMYGERFINVGVMEQQMIGVASGLSIIGFKPFIHTFTPFASRRVFDQVFLALNYNETNAVLLGSDAGIYATANGGTHMCFEDIALMRSIPHATVYEPSDNVVFKGILDESYKHSGFSYIRTIRSKPKKIHDKVDISKGYQVIHEGEDAVIIASGIMVHEALVAALKLKEKGIETKVFDLFRIKPLNEQILNELTTQKVIITAENHNIIGGVGSAISELFSEKKPVLIKRVGVKDSFGEVGSVNYLQAHFKLTSDEIIKQVEKSLNQ